jgi:uncharacterized phiE125 gp8 family phage protein
MGVFIHGWRSGYATAVHASSVVVTPPVLEPLTLTEAKLRAGQDWAAGDPRDALMQSFISAARAKVEHDTGLALLTQTRDVYMDVLPGDVFDLPAQSFPLQSVTSVKSVDTSGVTNTLNASNYTVDVASGRISISETGYWPTDLRAFQPWVIRIVAGWTTAALVPPLLTHAVGLLVAHYMTAGRDLVSAEGYEAVPYGYESAIAPHTLIKVI